MKRWFCVVYVLVVFFSWLVPAFGTFDVHPYRIYFQILSGETYSDTLTVMNVGEDDEEISIALEDWTMSEEGTISVVEAGSLTSSLAPYVIFDPTSFPLHPGESQDVSFTVSIPGEVPATCRWTMLSVFGKPLIGQAETEGYGTHIFKIQVRRGIILFQEDPTVAVREGLISKLQLGPVDESPAKPQFQIEFVNTGTTYLRPTGSLEIRDAQGQTAEELIIEEFYTLPGSSRLLAVATERPLEPGSYLALVVIDYGGPNLVAAQRLFEVPLEEEGAGS